MEVTQDRLKALRVEEVAERLQVELRTVYLSRPRFTTKSFSRSVGWPKKHNLKL